MYLGETVFRITNTQIKCFFTRFIDTYGTHIIVGVKMGGKDVIYAKQQHSSKLQPGDLQKRLKEVADKRFVEASGMHNMASERISSSKVCEIFMSFCASSKISY